MARKWYQWRQNGLVGSGSSLPSCGEGASLAFLGNPSSDGVTITF